MNIAMVRLVKIAVFVLVLVAAGASILWLRRDTERLQREAAALRRERDRLGQLRIENERARALLASAEKPGGAGSAVAAEITALKAQIAAHEQQVEQRREQGRQRRAAAAANIDPERGLVRLEQFQNVGRATPGEAFRTAVWAALHGRDDVLADAVEFEPAARAAVEEMMRTWPEALRAKYPAPENLAALLLAQVLTGHEAARLVAQDARDPQRGSVTVAFERMEAGQTLPMRLGPGGWRLLVAAEMLPLLRRQLQQTPDGK